MFAVLSSLFRSGVLARAGSLMILSVVALGAFVSPVTVSVGSMSEGVSIVASVGWGEVWATLEEVRLEALAAKNAPAAPAAKTDIWETILSLLNGLTNVFFSLLTPLLMLAGWLLTPDWVFGEIFGLRPVLHQLWVLVSNIVYIIFAFLLVAMAFMNIFAGEKNTWAIKAKLPKLIVGVISVPFTWFFVSAIVSISSILTASAIQLAGDLTPNNSVSPKITVYKDCTIDFTKGTLGKDSSAKFTDCKNPVETPLSDILKSKDAFGIVSYYAYSIFQIQELKSLAEWNLKTVKSVLDISVGLLVGIIFFFIMFLIVAALVVSMLMRAFYFWAIAIFSPLLSLRYFFDGKLWGMGDKWLTIPNIIGLAMVPVYVAAALAFGLVFLSAIKNTALTGTESSYVKVENSGDKQTIDAFGTKYTIVGKPVGATVKDDAIGLGGGFIGTLIIQIAWLAILWFAVMAALKSSDITKEASEPIAKFGSDIGGILKKLPQYAPVIPTGHGAASISSLWNIWSRVRGDIEGKQANRGQDIGASISKSLGVGTVPTVGAIQRIWAVEARDFSQAGKMVSDMIRASEVRDFNHLASSEKIRERTAFANVIDTKFKTIIPDDERKIIVDGLKSSSVESVRLALEKLEHKIGATFIWGNGTDFNTIDAANKAIKDINTQWAASTPKSSVPITIKPETFTLIEGLKLNLAPNASSAEVPSFTNQIELKRDLATKNLTNVQKLTYVNDIKAKLRWKVSDDYIELLLKDLGLTS